MESNAPFVTTIGVEHTRVPFCHLDHWNTKAWEISKVLNKEIRVRGLKEKGYSSAKPEDGAVEISSPVIKNEVELRNFWDTANSVFAKSPHRLVTNTIAKDTYIEGGGGHIHVGLQHLTKKQRDWFYQKAIYLSMQYPQIAWFFTEYVDDASLLSSFFEAVDYYYQQPIPRYNQQIIQHVYKDYSLAWGYLLTCPLAESIMMKDSILKRSLKNIVIK